MPAPVPVTTPVLLITATDDGVQLHVPVGVELLNVMPVPWHMGALPAIAPGVEMTVTTVATAPQAVV